MTDSNIGDVHGSDHGTSLPPLLSIAPIQPPAFLERDGGDSDRWLRQTRWMIRLSVYYPTTEGASFDHDYYRDKHVPLAVTTWGLKGAEIDKGIDGPYVAAVHFTFESLEALGAAMGAAGTADVLADVANYTTIAPVLQTSEIVG